MPTLTVYRINAFVEDDGSGGNPAGVVLEGDALSAQEKQALASRLRFSETAFVGKSSKANFKLEFFTPVRPIKHCGHATLAAFSLLVEKNKIQANKDYSHETPEGNRRIFVSDKEIFAEHSAPLYESVKAETRREVLSSLNLTEEDILRNAPVQIVSTGNRMLIVPLENQKALVKTKPAHEIISKISSDHDLVGYYLFSLETNDSERQATARMFAPAYGIHEESATGTGAASLACYLHDTLKSRETVYVIEQGRWMTKPARSKIVTRLLIENEKIKNVLVGGRSRIMKEQQITL